jgi:hypothetical protein
MTFELDQNYFGLMKQVAAAADLLDASNETHGR